MERFDRMKKLEQLKTNGSFVSRRTAEILQKDIYENIVSEMKDFEKQFAVELPKENKNRKETEENEDRFEENKNGLLFRAIINAECGDDT